MGEPKVPVGPHSCVVWGPVVWKVEELEDFRAWYMVFRLDIKAGTWKKFVKKVVNDDLFEIVFIGSVSVAL